MINESVARNFHIKHIFFHCVHLRNMFCTFLANTILLIDAL